jgi:hypothetical protein
MHRVGGERTWARAGEQGVRGIWKCGGMVCDRVQHHVVDNA